MRTSRRRAGFTLMEMLIVVAIIAILVAIAIPVFSNALDSARTATCQANCRSLEAEVKADVLTEGYTSNIAQAYKDAFAKRYQPGAQNDLCPLHGTYTIDANGEVSCSEHPNENAVSGVADKIQSWADAYAGGTGGTATREKLAASLGISSWPAVSGTNASGATTTYYLQVNSLNRNKGTTYVYAGPSSAIAQSGDTWKAAYIRDFDGQWYKLASVGYVTSSTRFEEVIASGTKVSLLGSEGSYRFSS